MELQTQRLNLKELAPTDLEMIHQLHSLPEIDQYNTMGIPQNIQITESLLSGWMEQQNTCSRETYVFSITHVLEHKPIGLIALNLGRPKFKIAEVWYKIHPAYWGKGYATEALVQLMRFGFCDLHLHRIEAGCAIENTASIRVLEKAGMIREGCKRKVLPIREKWMDNYLYSILETEI